jgi:ABC-type uncharacterized transport system permease subunit
VGEPGGGFANAILGSAKVLLLACLVGVPTGFLAGVYLAEFAGSTPGFIVRYTTDLLNGVPSIVIGMFAYAIIVVPMGHFSTLAGGIALGVMMIPITVRSTEEFLRAVPTTLREGALALGATKWNAVSTVVIPAAMPGIITGVMLALASCIGCHKVERGLDSGYSGRNAGDHNGCYAGSGESCWRDCTIALYGFRKSLLESRLESTHCYTAGHDLQICDLSLR